MAQKPSIPKGTRDFSAAEMGKRNYIFDTIREVFRLYGYAPIETPAMENLTTLMGKYGDEGDKLLFKILNSGDYLLKASPELLQTRDSAKLTKEIAEKGLRYDLTVPFARYVVQHREQITFPFKRSQIQPVWRADRPQKGRYREFYQCDADVIGSDSLLNEVELISMIDEVFRRLKIRVTIKINNRKLLAGIAELIGAAEKITDITVAIDKIEKIGIEAVVSELRDKGLSEEAISKLRPILLIDGSVEERLDKLSAILSQSETGMQGLKELREVISGVKSIGTNADIELDASLARGLNYYTGIIIEVKAKDVEIGSITGGGRYDNLTGIFGLPGVSGVGISFGADRIYDVLSALELYPENAQRTTTVLFANFGEEEAKASMKIMGELRRAGISSEIYADGGKIKKQLAYANSRGIPYVAIIGEEELKSGKVTLKDMKGGIQESLSVEEMIDKLA